MSSNAFDPIPNEINAIGTHIVDAAVKVHKAMGAGLLESVYEECMAYELQKRNLSVERQVSVPIQYDGNTLKTPLRIDLLVQNSVIVELEKDHHIVGLF